MVTLGSKGIKGPLLREEDDSDLLNVIEHLIGLTDSQAINTVWDNGENSARWVTSLLLLDIARSLRKISDGA